MNAEIPSLVNAVGGGDLKRELDLVELHDSLAGENVEYEPDQWAGLKLNFEEDSPTIIVFSSGNYFIAGADTVDTLDRQNDNFISELKELGIDCSNSSFEVRNLVYMSQYGRELDLPEITVALGIEYAEYDPEQFPGVFYKHPDVNGTFVLFRTGKIILTGLSRKKDAIEGLYMLETKLDSIFRE